MKNIGGKAAKQKRKKVGNKYWKKEFPCFGLLIKKKKST